MNEETAKLYIVGKTPCLLCGKALTQSDVTAGQVMGVGDSLNRLALFCLNHFYVKPRDTWEQVPAYDANMQRLAQLLAKGTQGGDNWNPRRRS